MKILDITREMLEAPVYPGDPAPSLEPLCRLRFGDACNTSALHACLHNGTHLDAPFTLSQTGRTRPRRRLTPAWGNAAWWSSTAAPWGAGGGASAWP